MEIAIGLMGVGLAVLGIVFAYIWKSNGRLQEKMQSTLEKMQSTLEKVAQMVEGGQEKLAQMLSNQTRILERIEGKIK